eukprot:1315090-Rhodomonas_salina.1
MDRPSHINLCQRRLKPRRKQLEPHHEQHQGSISRSRSVGAHSSGCMMHITEAQMRLGEPG